MNKFAVFILYCYKNTKYDYLKIYMLLAIYSYTLKKGRIFIMNMNLIQGFQGYFQTVTK